MRLRVGTLVHHDFERIFRGKPVMLEVNLTDYLPEGWSGTADWVVWNAERKAFVLGDLKTIKPEGIPWVLKEGVKDSHQHQLSAYWYALQRMGIPLVRGYGVLYLPFAQDAREPVQPTFQEASPLDEAYMYDLMTSRWAATQAYLASLTPLEQMKPQAGAVTLEQRFLTDELAPVQDREIRAYWNKAASKAKGKETPGVEVKLVPNWSTNYCDYANELCNCRTQKPEKLGTWLATADGVRFVPSRGKEGRYDERDKAGWPTDKQITDLKKEFANASESEGK